MLTNQLRLTSPHLPLGSDPQAALHAHVALVREMLLANDLAASPETVLLLANAATDLLTALWTALPRRPDQQELHPLLEAFIVFCALQFEAGIELRTNVLGNVEGPYVGEPHSGARLGDGDLLGSALHDELVRKRDNQWTVTAKGALGSITNGSSVSKF